MSESQAQALPQEFRIAAQGHEVVLTSAYMSPALSVVNQEDEEEPKSPTFPEEAKLKGQALEGKA